MFKKFIISLFLVLSFVTPVMAADPTPAVIVEPAVAPAPTVSEKDQICFPETVAADMIVEIEKGRIYQQQVDILKAENTELMKQIRLMREVVKLTQDQADATKKALESTKELLTVQADAYEQQLKKATPNPWTRALEWGGILAVGIVIGLLL